jgi:3'-phosphoadenosine 5'-phosphosulfate sulfotransferase (PAPS reductase)/FAD synthetase
MSKKKEAISEVWAIQNSGGRSSAYMTERLLRDKKFRENCVVTFQNTGKEKDQTLDFVHKCELRWKELYGQEVIWLEYNPDVPEKFSIVNYGTAHRTADKSKLSPFEKLIKRRQWLPNRMARYCTTELKIRVAKKYLLSLGFNYWTCCIGIRADEPLRFTKNSSAKERWNNVNPMVEWGTTKEDVNKFWQSMPFDLELQPHEGNCDLCFLKGAGKKRTIIRNNPEVADWWIRMEKEHGSTFRKEYSVQSLKDGIANAPEFQFSEHFECDIPCMCSVD